MLKNTESLRQSAGWYHSMTLAERIVSLHRSDNPSGAEPGNIQHAEENLQRWKEQAPFQTASLFADRLAMDSITESDLLALLAEPIEAVRDRVAMPAPPQWLEELARAFEEQSPAPDIHLPAIEDGEQFVFLQPLLPLFQRGIHRLQEGIHALSSQHGFLPFDPQAIVSLLFPNLARQILTQLNRTFVLELNIARLQGRLQGETPEERFQSYLYLLREKKEIIALLEEYCVLARQLVVTLDLWVTFSLEFLQHLCADWEQIRAQFALASDPGMLVAVSGGAGDTHRGGRSVMLLQFASGWQLVYKPKSLAIDVHFQELLTWLNEHGDHPGFKTVKLLDRGTYGWSEFVPACDCLSEEEVERFYERQGGYLALLYALEAIDFHSENIIASGEYPILVDLEALLHPRLASDGTFQSEHPALQALQHSVLRIALLPQRLWSRDDAVGIDISGLGGQEGQLLPFPVPKWESAQTDEMHLVRKRIKTSGSQNRPRLNGHEVQTSNYCDSIVKGFTTIYRLLMTHRSEFLAHLLPRFSHDEIRFVARATRAYALLLSESFHPNKLRDALKRERLFDRLWLAVPYEPHLSRLIPAERADLLNGDIPMFTTYPDSRDLITSQGEVIPDVFEEPSQELVRKRVEQLNEDDLARQAWIIRASFASTFLDIHDVTAQRLRLQPAHSCMNHQRLLLAARAVGDRLCHQALQRGEAAGWLSITLVKSREWNLQVSDMSLYSGTPGIALFLSYLGSITGDARYTALARSALYTIRADIERFKEHPAETGVGAFEGWGAVIYLFSHLGVLWNDPSLFHEAEELVALLPDLIEKDDRLDLLAGSAGSIASILSLHAVAPSASTLAVALQCGDHLLACAQPMQTGCSWELRHRETSPTGFLHGTVGIAWSLLKLARVSKQECFRLAAVKAMQCERSLFASEQSHRLSPPERDDEHSRMQTWCHGAPGIGLARLDSLQELDDEQIRGEIDPALKITLANGFGLNHSLCHGDFGNVETLLVASQTLHDAWYHEQTAHITAMLLDSLDAHGWITGVPLGVETPGLMTGLAGIGYQLLRLAEPEQVPSVLLLSPPVAIVASKAAC